MMEWIGLGFFAVIVTAIAGMAVASWRQDISLRAWAVTNMALPILYGNPDAGPGLMAAIEKDRRGGPALPPLKVQKALSFVDTMGKSGRRFELAASGDRQKGPHLLYFHGGAYVMQMIAPQWTIVSALVSQTGGTATVALYPLAPEHTWQQGLEAADLAFDELAERVGAENIVVAGDSAGGGLTLALTQRRRDAGKSLPGGLVLFSPWLDVTLSGRDQPQREKRDPTLRIAMLRQAGKLWAGDSDPASPPVSPLFGDMRGLPPTLVFAGTRDLLCSDALRLAEKDPTVRLKLYPEMFHVWMAAPIPEGTRALGQAAAFMREVTAL